MHRILKPRPRTMIRTVALASFAASILVTAAGCGEDAKPQAPAAKAQPAPVNVDRFLMQDDEEPGFDPIEEPRTDRGVAALAGGYSDDELQRLRRAGFLSLTFQPISGDDGSAGVSTVLLFKTAAGARDWLEFETSDAGIQSAVPGAKPKRFTVRGLPGARGWTGRDKHGNPIGHVYWAQGRCEMLIGNEGDGDYVKPLSTAARAIYERTQGRCP